MSANKKNKIEFSVLGMDNYQMPDYTDNPGQAWIGYGEDNNYPQYLIDLYSTSSIHSAICKGVSSMIYGEGLDATNRDEYPDQWMTIQTLLGNSNQDVLKNLAFDLKLFGTCYINVIWNMTRTKIAEIKHIPAQTIRMGKLDMTGMVSNYYYSADWSNFRKSENKPVAINPFSMNNRTEASSILCVKEYNPSSMYYGVPDYIGSTNYIDLDRNVGQFHLNNISNGLFPSFMLSFTNGIPTDEERQNIERKVYQKFSGSGNAGKVLITFNDGAETLPKLEPIQTNNADKLYEYMSQEISRKILSGHRVTSPLLFGVKGEGSGFGNNADELRDSYSLFNNTVIVPFQNNLLQALNTLFSANGVALDIYFKTLKPADFLDLETISMQDKDEQEKEGVNFASQDDVDRKPTKGMMEEAEKGLEWRREHKRGGTEIGVARARDIANGKNLSPDTIRRMKSFFARHEKNKKAEGFYPGEEGFPSASRIAWALWGGDPGQTWSEKKVKEIDRIRDENLEAFDFSDENNNILLSKIDEIGFIPNEEKWTLLHEEQVQNENDENDLEDRLQEFAYINKGNINKRTPFGDKKMFRIVYKYSTLGKPNSRDFCKKMIANSKSGYVYRKEDIDKLSQKSFQPRMGKGGAATYDIFKYKGGVNCYHKWLRVVYMRRTVPKDMNLGINAIDEYGNKKKYMPGEVLPPTLIKYYKKSTQAAFNSLGITINDKTARKRVIDMPRGGRVKN